VCVFFVNFFVSVSHICAHLAVYTYVYIWQCTHMLTGSQGQLSLVILSRLRAKADGILNCYVDQLMLCGVPSEINGFNFDQTHVLLLSLVCCCIILVTMMSCLNVLFFLYFSVFLHLYLKKNVPASYSFDQ